MSGLILSFYSKNYMNRINLSFDEKMKSFFSLIFSP